MLWLPSKDVSGFLTGGNQHGRVSGTTIFFYCFDRKSGHLSCSFNDFFYGKSNTISKVKNIAFLDEEEEETSPLWWLWGCLLTVAALSACAGLLLHYRLASLFQTILGLSVIFFFGGGALLFYFLKNKGKKASPPQENPVPEIHTPIDVQPVLPEPQSEPDDCFTVLLSSW